MGRKRKYKRPDGGGNTLMRRIVVILACRERFTVMMTLERKYRVFLLYPECSGTFRLRFGLPRRSGELVVRRTCAERDDRMFSTCRKVYHGQTVQQ